MQMQQRRQQKKLQKKQQNNPLKQKSDLVKKGQESDFAFLSFSKGIIKGERL